jgi:hypothetical protein
MRYFGLNLAQQQLGIIGVIEWWGNRLNGGVGGALFQSCRISASAMMRIPQEF